MKKLLIFILLFSSFAPVAAHPAPSDTIFSLWRKIQDSSAGNGSWEIREAFIQSALRDHYDFTSFYRKALREHWNTWTDGQRQAFAERFVPLFLRNLTHKIKKIPSAGVVLDEDPSFIKGDLAQIAFTGRKGAKTAGFKVFLSRVGTQWKIYDVEVEGALLSRNYQSQFNRILRNEKFEGLLSKLDQKLNSHGGP